MKKTFRGTSESTVCSMWLHLCFCIFLGSIGAEGVPRSRLTWVNGIGHSLQHMGEGVVDISSLFGGKKVEFCHNPTAMTSDDDYVGYIGDLTQAGTHKLGRITGEVDALVKHLKKALTAVGSRGRVVHIAHSQGALITNLALRQFSESELSRMEVLCFGGGAVIGKADFPALRRVVNYYSVNDPLLNINPRAVQALNSGFTFQNDPEFVFLTPRVSDPIMEHSLTGPTYMQALAWEGQRFQQQFQNPVYRALQPILSHYIAFCIYAAKKHDAFFIALYQQTLARLFVVLVTIIKKMIAPLAHLFQLLMEYIRALMKCWSSEEKYEAIPV